MSKRASVPEKKKHSKLGASNAERWMNCPGSVLLSEKAPPQAESRYAKEGTDAHLVLEAFLLDKPSPKCATPEMLLHAGEALEWIKSNTPEGAHRLVEEKVNLSNIHPEMFGTVDCAIIDDIGGEITIIDYKYGAGHAVEAKENLQLIYYALGVFNPDFHEIIHLVIIQPRAFHPDGPIRKWTLTAKELESYALKFVVAVEEVKKQYKDSPKFYSGTWCKWCPAAIICPEIAQNSFKQAALEFNEVVRPDLMAKTVNKLMHDSMLLEESELVGKALTSFEKIELWMERVREHAFNLMQKGATIPGWKLVEKRSTRKWNDPEILEKEATKKWGDKALTKPELLSPAQLEKAVPESKKWVNENTSAVSSGFRMVPDSDPRKATNQIDKDFDVIEDNS